MTWGPYIGLPTFQEEGYDEIRGEIEMLQQCNHPNVVRYLGSYQGEDYLWVEIAFCCVFDPPCQLPIAHVNLWSHICMQIVMEYCGGGSVADLMSMTDEPLEEQEIAYVCREALKVHRSLPAGLYCSSLQNCAAVARAAVLFLRLVPDLTDTRLVLPQGLAYLHAIFKVHRDIKGGNILLTDQGEVKLGEQLFLIPCIWDLVVACMFMYIVFADLRHGCYLRHFLIVIVVKSPQKLGNC